MFKELKWKYVDTKEKLRETAIIGGIDTGFSWGEITGASVLFLILLVFAIGFVIGPQLGADGETGVSDGSSAAGTGGQSDAVDGDSGTGGSDDVGDGGGGDGDGAGTDDGGGDSGDAGTGGSGGDPGDVSEPEAESDGDGEDDGDAGGNGTETEETSGFDVEAFENAVHGSVNGERRAANRTPLEHVSALRDTARTHSERMASRGVVRHEIPEGVGFEEHFRREGVDRCLTDGNYTGGQNVARTYFETELSGGERFTDEGELAGHVVDSWMAGNGTRRNLLAVGFTAEGIGARYVSSDDAVYVTQHLC